MFVILFWGVLIGLPITLFVLLCIGVIRIVRSPHRKLLIALCLAGVMAGCSAWKAYELEFMLSFVPDALGVSTMSYSKEENWGSLGLPGDNEFGLRVYPLSEQVARQISAQGAAYFEAMPRNRKYPSREWRGYYEHWQQTPLKADGRPGAKDGESPIDWAAYNHGDGLAIVIDPAILQQLKRIIQSPGAYYAHGRIGTIVVSPRERVVFYVFSG